jgi:hypothetical protein
MLELLALFGILVVGTIVLGSLFLIGLVLKLVFRILLLPLALLFGVLKFFLFAILIVIGIAVAPVALVLLFLFGIPVLLVMGVVGLGTAMAAS